MTLKFSEDSEAKFEQLVSRYPNTHAALLPALLLAQSEFGWISVEVMDYVAERLELNPAQVLSTATFYTMFNKQPIGKAHIQVCTTLTCAVCGGYEIIEHLEERLGIRLGETTPDGKYTLSEAECLASCGTAPMFQITYSDGEMEYHENLTLDSVDQLLEDLDEKLADLPTPSQMHP